MHLFSPCVTRFPLSACTSLLTGYISHYLVLGGFCCISVSSPPFFIIKGSFTMYSNVVWRAQRDEGFACPCSRAIPHCLFWGGRLCCISVTSPPFFIVKGLIYNVLYIIVSFEGSEEARGAHVLVPDIFHIIWFWEGSAVSQSVLHHFLSLNTRLQCIPI